MKPLIVHPITVLITFTLLEGAGYAFGEMAAKLAINVLLVSAVIMMDFWWDQDRARITRLESSLRDQFCRRPCNGRSSDLTVGECSGCGECGCGASDALRSGGRP
ncbi:MAG: hypothetical protein ABII76_21815 [Pseudomonadota bacterium]